MRGLPAGRPRPLWGAGRQRSSNAPCADPSRVRAGRRADLHGGLSPRGAEHALRERPWREPSRGPAQTAVETTVGLDGEDTAQPGGPTNRRPGTARPGSRAEARAPFSESPGLRSGRCLPAPKCTPAVRAVTRRDRSSLRAEDPSERRGEPRGALDRPARHDVPARPAIVDVVLRVEPGDDGGLDPPDPQGQPLPDAVVVEPGDDQVEAAVICLVLVGEARLVADQRDRLAGERAALPVADVPENDVPVIDAVLGGGDRPVGGAEPRARPGP